MCSTGIPAWELSNFSTHRSVHSSCTAPELVFLQLLSVRREGRALSFFWSFREPEPPPVLFTIHGSQLQWRTLERFVDSSFCACFCLTFSPYNCTTSMCGAQKLRRCRVCVHVCLPPVSPWRSSIMGSALAACIHQPALQIFLSCTVHALHARRPPSLSERSTKTKKSSGRMIRFVLRSGAWAQRRPCDNTVRHAYVVCHLHIHW